MAKRNSMVTIKVHRDYFEKVFEPQRITLQKKLGLNNLTQVNFTNILYNTKIKGDYPKQSAKYFPKLKKRGVFF
jgi:hypothetical protein